MTCNLRTYGPSKPYTDCTNWTDRKINKRTVTMRAYWTTLDPFRVWRYIWAWLLSVSPLSSRQVEMADSYWMNILFIQKTSFEVWDTLKDGEFSKWLISPFDQEFFQELVIQGILKCIWLLIWHQEWVTRVRQLVLRSLSLGRKMFLLFTGKYAVPRQMKPRILELSIRISQSNFSSFSTFFLAAKKSWCT